MSTPSATGDWADPREIRGWQLYDWANSAFTTTVVAALAGPYLTIGGAGGAGEDGVLFRVSASGSPRRAGFPYVVSLSVLLQVLVLPMLGALTDGLAGKKPVLLGTCLIGSTATTGLVFVSGDRWLLGGALFASRTWPSARRWWSTTPSSPSSSPRAEHDRISSRRLRAGLPRRWAAARRRTSRWSPPTTPSA